jgi:hypothetical protein
MQEQIVKFETAELAYSKGLPRFLNSSNDLPCYKISNKSFVNYHVHTTLPNKEEYLYAPTQSLLQKWLRDEYGVYVEINCYTDSEHISDKTFRILIISIKYQYIIKSFEMGKYEEALEAGLFESLKLIKN